MEAGKISELGSENSQQSQVSEELAKQRVLVQYLKVKSPRIFLERIFFEILRETKFTYSTGLSFFIVS